MKVTEYHAINGAESWSPGSGSVSIALVNAEGRKRYISLMAGEPEDATFDRDLNDAFSITDLIKMAYEAGKRGEPYDYECINENEEEGE